jgi:heparin/heparan-sulfate lyase
VHDPCEIWPGIRAGSVSGNDGGQHHDWPHHNGAVIDAAEWQKGRQLYDIADILAFEDKVSYVYVAGDCTRSYSPKKLEYFTRQIVFLRPGLFIIFDRVSSRNPHFKKTWLLQAMMVPAETEDGLVITNGKGRLFIQTLLPSEPKVKLVTGDELYSYGGNTYPPARDTGPAPQCRTEISPPRKQAVDYFLHVLTATDADVNSVEKAHAQVNNKEVIVTIGQIKIRFGLAEVRGHIEFSGRSINFTDKIVVEPAKQTGR